MLTGVIRRSFIASHEGLQRGEYPLSLGRVSDQGIDTQAEDMAVGVQTGTSSGDKAREAISGSAPRRSNTTTQASAVLREMPA
jgi:hypothetical protein